MAKEHNEMFDRPEELMYTNLDELLPKHGHLLMVDSTELGEGPLAEKQIWILKMEATKLAKEKLDEAGTIEYEWTEVGQ